MTFCCKFIAANRLYGANVLLIRLRGVRDTRSVGTPADVPLRRWRGGASSVALGSHARWCCARGRSTRTVRRVLLALAGHKGLDHFERAYAAERAHDGC